MAESGRPVASKRATIGGAAASFMEPAIKNMAAAAT
jgi:hypothetical protein